MVAHIIFVNKDGKDGPTIISEINNHLQDVLSKDLIPHYYKVRNEMPINKNGKRDVKALIDDKENLIKMFCG